MAGASPSASGAAGLWILGGLIAASGAFVYAECGARLPHTGGFYVFYREAFGRPIAFVGGWAALLVTYPSSVAAIALVFAQYLHEAVPFVPGGLVWPAAAAILLAGILNALGVRTSAWAQRLLTGSKVAALGALCLAAALAPASPRQALALETSPAGGVIVWSGLLSAMVVMLWTYDGWTDVTLVAGEIREPGRNLGRAVLLGTGILIVLYVTVQISVSVLLSPAEAAASSRVVADAVETGLGPGSGRIVALLVVVCTFGSINGIVLAISRLVFAMARDGVFLKWFGEIHRVFETPARSVAAVVGSSIFYVFVAGFRNLINYFSFAVWIFYGLTAVALLVLRRRRVGEPPGFRAPLGLLAPAVVLATAAGMTSYLMAQNPEGSWYGLAMLLAGFPAYGLWRWWDARRAPGR